MPFSRLFAGPLTVGTTLAGLAAGSVLAVVAYRDLSTVPPSDPVPLTLAEARGPHPAAVPAPRVLHRLAPCAGGARLVGGACVTTVQRTVVVTDPPPTTPAAPAAAPAVPPRAAPPAPTTVAAAAPVARAKPTPARRHEPREHESQDD